MLPLNTIELVQILDRILIDTITSLGATYVAIKGFKLDKASKELRNNGGTSLKDRVDQTNKSLTDNGIVLDLLVKNQLDLRNDVEHINEKVESAIEHATQVLIESKREHGRLWNAIHSQKKLRK